ncbi:hypothetical protein AFA91_11870 [Mycolicibacterium goodii]|uniref:Uncharacterized protein n=1 Tax=Mycolicibacterium goodii TaxID=134601 RepID=A0A0K0X4Z6_MYCGD|nr:hypothetical protein AFA91_11870 [Mycolicibacterium goodii]
MVHEFVESVLDLLAGVVQVRLCLAGVTVTLSTPVARSFTGCLFGLADEMLGLVLRLIHTAHGAGIP